MVKKKTKSSKKLKKQGDQWLAEDVKVHTALPPQVDGQLRCFCKVTVGQILWLTPLCPDLTLIRIKWWGEHGEGSVFKPLDVKKGEKGPSRTTARYPVRSGPRQFAAYLDDMGSMSIEVLSGPMSIPVGQALITEIGLLSNSRPINGFFPVFSKEEEKIAEVHVSIMLEPLMASYDSLGSIPTTDVSVETFTTQDSAYPQRVLPTPHHQKPVHPEQDPFISPASHQADTSQAKESETRRDIRQRLHYQTEHHNTNAAALDAGDTVSITANGDVVTTHANHNDVVTRKAVHGIASPRIKFQHSSNLGEQSISSLRRSQTRPKEDLLSVLLDKGKKLRDAMAISSLHNSAEMSKLKEIKAEEIQIPVSIASSLPNDLRSSSGSLFKEILQEDVRIPSASMTEEFSDTKTVDLAVNSPIRSKDFKTLQMENGLSPGLRSSLSSVDDAFSDPNDPIQEESILNELFYNRSASEQSGVSDYSGDERSRLNSSVGSVEDPGNVRPPSRHSSMSSLNVPFPEPVKKKKKSEKSAKKTRPYDKPWRRKVRRPRSRSRSRSRSKSASRVSSGSELSDGELTPRSETSRVSFDMTPSDVEEPVHEESQQSSSVDGLSVERLTLLGRVHVARVTVDALILQKDLDTSRSSRKSDRVRPGRPPRPVTKTKKSSTYFIEYQFPVVATSRDKYSPNAMATEVMRVASKNVKSGVVTFNHRSVFPIMFDGSSVEKWWKSALVFKIFSREAGQKIPAPVGSCGVPLKSILKSDSLCVSREMEVRVSSKNSSLNGSFRGRSCRGLFGHLKVTVELASDHKEFATALAKTKLAEMSGKVKIVPVIAPPAPPKPPPPQSVGPPVTSTFPQGQTNQVFTQTAGQSNPGFTQTAGQPNPGFTQNAGQPNPGFSQAGVQQPSALRQTSSDVSFPQGIDAVAKQHARVNINNNYQYVSPATFVQPVQFDSNTVQQNVNQSANATQNVQTMAANHQIASAMQNFSTSQSEALTLHVLLMVPEGRNIGMEGVPPLHLVNKRPMLLHHQPHANIMPGMNMRDVSTRNIYLVCRMFWCNDEIRSSVCWGTSQPEFNLTQVVPVLVTTSLLERMRNNFMVIEVWDKKTSAETDKLIGMVKLSLHQFYLSFKDIKIATALLKSQFPVIGADNYLAVTNPFTSFQFGQLRVLLAMGSAEQISSLQKLKLNGDTSSSPERPNSFLERQDAFSGINRQQSDTSVEHVFEVVIEEIRGLKLFENMIWGEADSFVQYHFPSQAKENQVKHVVPTMKSYRTATTLCIPDPTFHDVIRHRIVLPQGTPVQRELLTACSNSGGGISGLPFEVWCRYYHPNIRDQVIAKATLPLAKLCAMVTMQKRGEPSTQAFSLPLTQIAMETDMDTDVCTKVKDSGLLDITIHYKTNIIHNEPSLQTASASTNSSHVCISVGVIRASGLKAAAERLARLDSGMQYPSEVGVNAYVSIHLSFVSKEGERHTKTIARTFAPEFSYYMDFPCPLLWTDPQTDGHSLAEMLQSAEATFEVWHQIPGTLAGPVGQYVSTGSEDVSGRSLIQKTGDVLLGTSTVLLTRLLTHRTGIVGWFPLKLPPLGWERSHTENSVTVDDDPGDRGLDRVGGGVELSLRFAHLEDRDRVIHAGRSVGWSPGDLDIEESGWQETDELREESQQVTVGVDRVCFPLHNSVRVGQSSLDKTARCYVRYKFYDKTAVISKSRRLRPNDANYVVTGMKHKHKTVVQTTSPYLWYLREERLEVQVWVSYGSHKEQRSRHRDKLIGSAFIDLDSLCDNNKHPQRISGIFPLFKPGVASLGGGYIRAHVTAETLNPHRDTMSDSEVLLASEVSRSSFEVDSECETDDSFHRLGARTKQSPHKKQAKPEPEADLGPSFHAHIHIDRAMHLPYVTDNNRSGEFCPTTYVTFQSAESPSLIYTSVIPNSVSPVWDYQTDTRLSTELLHTDGKNLVFKVWHKPTDAGKNPDKSCDRVLGFVSVDLSPLTSGLQSICGWYNIVDFNGQCKGQIKVNIVPQETLSSATAGLPAEQSFPTRMASLHTPTSFISPFPPRVSTLNPVHQQPTSAPQNTSHNINRHDDVTRHWQPTFPSFPSDDSSSKSYLFSSLRKNLEDLDILTQNLKKKLTTSDTTASTQQRCSQESEHAVANVSQSQGESTRTGGDSGAFSGENSYDRIHESTEAQDSSRSGCHSYRSVEQHVSGSEQLTGAETHRSDDLSREEKSNLSPDSGYRNGNFSMSTPRELQMNAATNAAGGQDFTNTLSTLEDISGNTGHDSLKTPRDFLVNHELSQGFIPGQMDRDNGQQTGHQTIVQDMAVSEEEQNNYDDDDEEEEEKYGSYRRYEDLLSNDDMEGHDVDVDADDESEDVHFIKPRTLNSMSAMLTNDDVVVDELVDIEDDWDERGNDRRTKSDKSKSWTKHGRDSETETDDETKSEEIEHRTVEQRTGEARTVVDSWLSENSDTIKKIEDREETKQRLLSNVELIDTLTSTLSNSQDRNKSSDNRERCEEQVWSSGAREQIKVDCSHTEGKMEGCKETGHWTKVSETDLISPGSSAHSGPHSVNYVTHTDRVTEDSGVESGTKSSQDDRDVSYTSDLLQHTRQVTKLPDFFMPAENMHACMRALQVAITLPDCHTQTENSRSSSKSKAASELKEKVTMDTRSKFAAISAKNRPLPTAEEAKRIAKIFSAKLS